MQKRKIDVRHIIALPYQIHCDDVAAYAIKDGNIFDIKRNDLYQIDPAEIDLYSSEINQVYTELLDADYEGHDRKIPDECCDDCGNAKVLVCQENNRKYVIYNNSGRNLLKIRMDGCLIISGTRCDFAVDIDSTDVYLIELKGKDLRKACIQLEASYKYFKDNFNYKTINCRVVLSKMSRLAHTHVK